MRPAVARRVRVADQHAVHRCRRLQPGGRVDSISDTIDPAVAAEPQQHLAGGDADAHVQRQLRPFLTQGFQLLLDRERCTDGPLGVVLVSDRRAEKRHHAVADELGDDAAEPLHLLGRDPVEGRQKRAHILDVQ